MVLTPSIRRVKVHGPKLGWQEPVGHLNTKMSYQYRPIWIPIIKIKTIWWLFYLYNWKSLISMQIWSLYWNRAQVITALGLQILLYWGRAGSVQNCSISRAVAMGTGSTKPLGQDPLHHYILIPRARSYTKLPHYLHLFVHLLYSLL